MNNLIKLLSIYLSIYDKLWETFNWLDKTYFFTFLNFDLNVFGSETLCLRARLGFKEHFKGLCLYVHFWKLKTSHGTR